MSKLKCGPAASSGFAPVGTVALLASLGRYYLIVTTFAHYGYNLSIVDLLRDCACNMIFCSHSQLCC